MLLASPDLLAARLGRQQASTSFLSSAEAALHAATAELEARIGYSFDRFERTDYFGGCYSNDGSASSPLVRLNLSGGFVDSSSPVSVYQSSNGEPILTVGDAHALLLDPAEKDYEIEWGTGRVVLFFAPALAEFRRSMAVVYTHGFVANGEIYQNVPSGLQEAAISMAAGVLQAFTPPNGRIDLTSYSDAMSRITTTQANRYIRSRMVGNNSQFTETA